jgi:hypothetical protein
MISLSIYNFVQFMLVYKYNLELNYCCCCAEGRSKEQIKEDYECNTGCTGKVNEENVGLDMFASLMSVILNIYESPFISGSVHSLRTRRTKAKTDQRTVAAFGGNNNKFSGFMKG